MIVYIEYAFCLLYSDSLEYWLSFRKHPDMPLLKVLCNFAHLKHNTISWSCK